MIAVILPTGVALAESTERISVNSAGVEGNGFSAFPSLNGDGGIAAFWSQATTLVPGDTNAVPDIFVRDQDAGTTRRVSVSSAGVQGNDESFLPSISNDGRFVAFGSRADNLVPGDTNATSDIFVHDRVTGVTERVSRSGAGVQTNGGSTTPSISANGRFVAFASDADNLVAGDTNGATDVFVVDRSLGSVRRVSVNAQGLQGNSDSNLPAISADGTAVAYRSEASNLVPVDRNATVDVFVHELAGGGISRVSIDSAGLEANAASSEPTISDGGRFVGFWSAADNLVTDDFNGANDIFVHDRMTGETERISLNDAGMAGDGDSSAPAITADGRLVAFRSNATNLVPNDLNGLRDVFLHDRARHTTVRVSVSSDGQEGNGVTFEPAISAEGRHVAYWSNATNLVPNDMNNAWDVFVFDRAAPMVIDFKPHDPDNRVAPLGEGRIGIMIESTQVSAGEITDLDARDIDPDTVRAGPAMTPTNGLPSSLTDFDGDGDLDLIVRSEVPDLGLDCADTHIGVIAETFQGQLRVGADEVDPQGCGTRTVTMDFKPNDPLNRVAVDGTGLVGAAVLSSGAGTGAAFNATEIDAGTVRLGRGMARPTNGGLVRDVDGDGLPDMVLNFQIEDLGLACGDQSIALQGETVDALPFQATDSVTPLGCP
jgi:Tol biopolymer transport system component